MTETDSLIIQTWKRHKEQALSLLMEAYSKPLYGYVRRLVVVHEDAEDVLQNTFIKAYEQFSRFHGDAVSLHAWMYRIATTESMQWLRKKKCVSLDEGDQPLSEKLYASDYVDYDNVYGVRFQAALLRLPEKQRLVFNLRYYEELSYKEIASVMESSEEAARMNYSHAKRTLEQELKEELYEP